MTRLVERSVLTAVAASLGAHADQVTRDASLFVDLGADWLDLMDILLRIERAVEVRVRASDLAAYLQGAPTDHALADGRGYMSSAELMTLQRLMPQIDVSALRGKLRANHLMRLFTVGDLVDLVAQRGLTLAA